MKSAIIPEKRRCWRSVPTWNSCPRAHCLAGNRRLPWRRGRSAPTDRHSTSGQTAICGNFPSPFGRDCTMPMTTATGAGRRGALRWTTRFPAVWEPGPVGSWRWYTACCPDCPGRPGCGKRCAGTGRPCGKRPDLRTTPPAPWRPLPASSSPTAPPRPSRPYWRASLSLRTGGGIPWSPCWDAVWPRDSMRRRRASCRLLWPTAKRAWCPICSRREKRRRDTIPWTLRFCLSWQCMNTTGRQRTLCW